LDINGDGTDDVYAWCESFLGSSLPSGTYNLRVVSAIAGDETTEAPETCDSASASTNWVPMDIGEFCTATSDDYCRTGYTANDGCGNSIGEAVRLRFSEDPSYSIAPY
jgi:hypothetical protein